MTITRPGIAFRRASDYAVVGSRQNAGEIFTRFTQSRGFSWYCRELLRPPPITGTRRHGLFLHQVDSARLLSVLYVCG